jgi:hypothetical protein
MDGPAFIQYRSRLDLLGQTETNSDVILSRNALLAQPEIQMLFSQVSDWPGKVISSHKSASQTFHTLNFLVDIGIKSGDPGMGDLISRILAQASPEGPFRLPMNIGSAYGGTGEDTRGWALCDAPNLVYALLKLGLADNLQVIQAVNYMVNLIEDFGWPCAVSPELGSFRGPGRKNDPCPYANLIMMKVLSLSPEGRNHPAAKTGSETLLSLWQNRQKQHPYIFYMGTDFCKLKAPLIWYDILHVLDVLSAFPGVIKDSRFQAMLETALQKMTPDRTFIPESIYLPYKNWDFGQKKDPSRWITFLMYRIMQRAEIV